MSLAKTGAAIIKPSRRQILKSAGAFGAFAAFFPHPQFSLAANPSGKKLHGLSAFGELKYAADFSHFDFANPDAPQGGKLSFQPSYWYFNQSAATFNTLNSFVLKGEAPPRMELCFDTLMAWAWDEPDALYCALAKNVEISNDRNRYRFELRPEARFHDGSPITADDVAFSCLTLKQKGHPQILTELKQLDDVVIIDQHTLELVFSGRQSDRAILSMANLVPILPEKFYQKMPLEDHVMEPPLGSGPYKVGRFKPGVFIEYERVRDYWANDLGFAKGLDHFDTFRIDFFAERQAGFEAFKKGEILLREEFTSKSWATAYDFPAVTEGKVKKSLLPGEARPSMQALAINSRRGKFKDVKTRQAIALAFDFKWVNKNLFYGAYDKSHAIFEKSDFAATGEPSPEELALLEPYRSELPKAVFGPAVMQYEGDGSGRDRKALKRAKTLLEQAGWQQKGGEWVNQDGERLEIEILIRASVFERVFAPLVENLRAIQIPANMRLVDPAQYQTRLESFDFDITMAAFSFSPTPTTASMRNFIASQAADQNGSHNYPGIKNAAVDGLVKAIGKAKTRAELVFAMKALDRVLRAMHLWIPSWHSGNHRLAHWDVFGWKDKPDYFFPVERLWWFETEKAKAIGFDQKRAQAGD